MDNPAKDKPLVVITGAAGNIGRSLAAALAQDYRIVGFDLKDSGTDFPLIEVDITKDDSVRAGMDRLRSEHGDAIASVIHLAAFFDFSGEEKQAYKAVNVEGTRRLLRALQSFEVEQFLYSGTMLVHAPGEPGEVIDESQPIEPGWAYPKSKAETEDVIRAEHGAIPYVLLHLAGVYDETTSVPTFAHQIARIYERDFQSHLYSGATDAGQAMLHREDMIDAFVRTVNRRESLPPDAVILVGESETLGYDALQDRLGALIHGEDEWTTIRVPATLAAVGAWAQDKAEPLVPDAIDQGERPFIQPFMTRMASDHYALDTRRAQEWLGWRPRHSLAETLPAMVDTLKRDPAAWYAANKVPAPEWLKDAEDEGQDPEALRVRYETVLRAEHRSTRWVHFVNMALGLWLLTQPVMVQVTEPLLFWSEIALGGLVIVFATLSLSWRMGWARWVCAGLGALIMAIPFVFWTTNPAAFLSDTLVGALIFGFAIGTRPEVGPTPTSALHGPEKPPGWDFNPSSWTQRLPIILFALVGLLVSRYLAAYQLGQIDGVWEPFFAGSPDDPQNGTEEIITSSVSEAWPVPDAAIGGYTYALEILTGIVGTQKRWRTMPWLVLLFGLMIVPLGVVSIFFIIIQPIVIGTWATLTLLAAAAMLIQIPYALDEILATVQFMRRRVRAGKSWLRVFLFGDTDEGASQPRDEFDQAPGAVVRDMFGGGVGLPWNLAVAGLIALSLLFTRLTFGAGGAMADMDHLIGALSLTVISIAASEVARPVRYLLIPLGLALIVAAFATGTSGLHLVASLVAGVALGVLSLRGGTIHNHYGDWRTGSRPVRTAS
ncbi:vitamin K epoxide reductase family protein [Iodidimonas sp. SYSU 1G8]|uniref:vitamin K epoxide reductase family protein n=1 Tax=Iodidimonas sp. SYSU 1G8 TaxID=3133967 RepID=UPI0031FE8ADC